METNNINWHCIICNTTIKKTSKNKHLTTNKHNKKLNHTQQNECLICLEKYPLPSFKSCTSCTQNWCEHCDQKVAECPYCRASLGRNEQLVEIKRLNTNWQLDQDAFSINQPRTYQENFNRQHDTLRFVLSLFLQ